MMDDELLKTELLDRVHNLLLIISNLKVCPQSKLKFSAAMKRWSVEIESLAAPLFKLVPKAVQQLRTAESLTRWRKIQMRKETNQHAPAVKLLIDGVVSEIQILS